MDLSPGRKLDRLVFLSWFFGRFTLYFIYPKWLLVLFWYWKSELDTRPLCYIAHCRYLERVFACLVLSISYPSSNINWNTGPLVFTALRPPTTPELWPRTGSCNHVGFRCLPTPSEGWLFPSSSVWYADATPNTLLRSLNVCMLGQESPIPSYGISQQGLSEHSKPYIFLGRHIIHSSLEEVKMVLWVCGSIVRCQSRCLPSLRVILGLPLLSLGVGDPCSRFLTDGLLSTILTICSSNYLWFSCRLVITCTSCWIISFSRLSLPFAIEPSVPPPFLRPSWLGSPPTVPLNDPKMGMDCETNLSSKYPTSNRLSSTASWIWWGLSPDPPPQMVLAPSLHFRRSSSKALPEGSRHLGSYSFHEMDLHDWIKVLLISFYLSSVIQMSSVTSPPSFLEVSIYGPSSIPRARPKLGWMDLGMSLGHSNGPGVSSVLLLGHSSGSKVS